MFTAVFAATEIRTAAEVVVILLVGVFVVWVAYTLRYRPASKNDKNDR